MHVDSRFALRNSLDTLPRDHLIVTSGLKLKPSPIEEGWTIVAIVVIAKLVAADRTERWLRLRDARLEIIVVVAGVWKSDSQTCAPAHMAILLELVKLTMIILPQGKMESHPAACIVVLLLYRLKKLSVRLYFIALQT